MSSLDPISSSLSYNELRALAKAEGIAAGGKKIELFERLKKHEELKLSSRDENSQQEPSSHTPVVGTPVQEVESPGNTSRRHGRISPASQGALPSPNLPQLASTATAVSTPVPTTEELEAMDAAAAEAQFYSDSGSNSDFSDIVSEVRKVSSEEEVEEVQIPNPEAEAEAEAEA
eukprot:GSChrysophyteH1.ASY1.ANO1.2189.1 assembled CDS